MAEQPTEAAVLFADVSGSTKLYETAGDAVAHAAIEKCIGIMREKTVGAQAPRFFFAGTIPSTGRHAVRDGGTG